MFSVRASTLSVVLSVASMALLVIAHEQPTRMLAQDGDASPGVMGVYYLAWHSDDECREVVGIRGFVNNTIWSALPTLAATCAETAPCIVAADSDECLELHEQDDAAIEVNGLMQEGRVLILDPTGGDDPDGTLYDTCTASSIYQGDDAPCYYSAFNAADVAIGVRDSITDE